MPRKVSLESLRTLRPFDFLTLRPILGLACFFRTKPRLLRVNAWLGEWFARQLYFQAGTSEEATKMSSCNPFGSNCPLRLRISRVALGILLFSTAAWAQWPQFGGPNRDFTVESGQLATEWPEGGPKELWRREFGDGFSSILVEGDRLYTMRRDGDQDVAVCLEARSGQTIWETAYDSPTVKGMILDFGPGPISTPLLSGSRLFTVSSTVKFHALEKETGKVLWARDLMEEMKASHMGRGYGPSPIGYKDLVILALGGKDQAVVAFKQESGQIAWKSQSLPPSYSSPILVRMGGQDVLIISMGDHRAGLDPASGELKWDLDVGKNSGPMMSTQHLGDDLLLFGSNAYSGGSRAIQLSLTEGGIQAEQLWYHRKMRVMYASFVRIGDYVYGSSGDFGPAFLIGLNVKSGQIAWRKRGFGRAHFLQADGKVIILDEEGDLAIASARPEGLTVHARANVIDRVTWTPPTLVGTTLYLRNTEIIKALDLGM